MERKEQDKKKDAKKKAADELNQLFRPVQDQKLGKGTVIDNTKFSP